MSCHEDCQCRPGVVALVFVPGIMGTRLKNRRSGSSVWDPAAGAAFEGPSGAAIEIKAQREQEMADAGRRTTTESSKLSVNGSGAAGLV